MNQTDYLHGTFHFDFKEDLKLNDHIENEEELQDILNRQDTILADLDQEVGS